MGNPRRRNTPNSVGEDPLHQAARSGDLQSVQSICSSDPLAINSRDKHSRTPYLNLRLHLAAWSGQTEVVSYLCKNKADVGAAAMDDMGAIHFAAQKGHLEVVRTLLTSGVSIKSSNRKGLTPLHYAAQGSHMELVKYLVRKGASLTAKTKAGKTPLDLANEEVRSFFIECEMSSKKGEDQADQGKTEEFDPKPSLEDKVIGLDDETVTKREDKEEEEDRKDEKVKRKDEEVEIEGNLLKPKKARIALSHLQAEDYTQEDAN